MNDDRPSSTDDILESSPFKGDLDAELAAPPRSFGRPTVYLGAGVLLVAGFLGGIQAEKAWSNEPQSSPATPSQRGYGNAPGGGMASGGAMQRGGGLTTGTVTKVTGGTVYLRTSDGKTVAVKTSDSTNVQVTRKGNLKDLKTGTAITVRGVTGQDGSLTASTINQGAAPSRP